MSARALAGWACTGSASPVDGRIDVTDPIPAWCQELPSPGWGVASLGWTDDPEKATAVPSAVAVLVPAGTTGVRLAGLTLRTRTVDGYTWAVAPGLALGDRPARAPLVVLGVGGAVTWQGTYGGAALRTRVL